MVRLGFAVCPGTFALRFAHRDFCARLIRLRADAERVPLGFVYELPPFNLPRTVKAASRCFSWFTRFVLSTLNSATIDASPFRFAIVPLRDNVSRSRPSSTLESFSQKRGVGRRLKKNRLQAIFAEVFGLSPIRRECLPRAIAWVQIE